MSITRKGVGGYAVALRVQAGGAGISFTAGFGHVPLNGFTPAVTIGGSVSFTAGFGHVPVNGASISVTVGGNVFFTAPFGHVPLVGGAASIVVSGVSAPGLPHGPKFLADVGLMTCH